MARERRRRPRVPARRLDRPRARRGRRARGRGPRPPVPPGAPRAARRAPRSCSPTTTRCALAVGRDDAGPGGLPLGQLEVRRSYFDPSPIVTTRDDEQIQVWPAHDRRGVLGAAPRGLPRRRAARTRSRCVRPTRARPLPRPSSVAGPQGRRVAPDGSHATVRPRSRAHARSRSTASASEIGPSSRRSSSRNVERLAHDPARARRRGTP